MAVLLAHAIEKYSAAGDHFNRAAISATPYRAGLAGDMHHENKAYK